MPFLSDSRRPSTRVATPELSMYVTPLRSTAASAPAFGTALVIALRSSGELYRSTSPATLTTHT